MNVSVAVLTVSDTAAHNAAEDLSGPHIREFICSKEGYQVLEGHYQIVPDVENEIRDSVSEWVDSGKVDWVITTGGTGFGVRDVTPEALLPLIQRPAPGIVHLLLSSSLKKTPFAALSRPVAGTAKNTLIITLPGSVKAVKENLEILFEDGVIHHALDLIKGGSGHELHSQLSSSGPTTTARTHGHHHHHNHNHGHGHPHGHHGGHQPPKPRSQAALSNDLSASVASRQRQSPFPLVSLEEAFQLIKANSSSLDVVNLPVNENLAGHVLADDIYAAHDIPSTFTTNVDGYALHASDEPGVYNVLTSQTHPIGDPLPQGSIFRVNTGGPIPAGADAVIMVEDTKLASAHAHHPEMGRGVLPEEKEVETLAQVPRHENIREPGSDIRKGELVMSKGERITKVGGEVGTLAFVGRREVEVYRKPRVAILSTGNEIVDVQQQTSSEDSSSREWGGIFDTNRPSLATTLRSLGYEVVDLGIVADTIEAHLGAMKKGLAKADVLITTGGTSMGSSDLLKPLIERYLNGTIHFGRVNMKPGKPTTFATVPVEVDSDVQVRSPSDSKQQIQVQQVVQVAQKPIFGLPGNPASALCTFYVFVIPALRKMSGFPDEQLELPRVNVELQDSIRLDQRPEYHRVLIKSSLQSGQFSLKAYSTGGQRSSRIVSLCNANGLVILPSLDGGHGKRQLEKGEHAKALLIGEIEME